MNTAWWISIFPGIAIVIDRARLQPARRRPRRPAEAEAVTAPRIEHRRARSQVRRLTTVFASRSGPLTAVDGVDLDLAPGEILGLVGESGSGKSVTLRSLLRLVHPPGRVAGAGAVGRARPARAPRGGRCAQRAGPRDRDDLPGAHDGAEPGAHRRPADRREPAGPHGARRARPARPRGRTARPRRHPGAGRRGSTTIRTSSRAACASAP